MDSFDLHSLILEELSTVLAATCRPTDTSSTDPAVQKVLAQCPPLPSQHSEQALRVAVTKRHENGILALAKLLSTTSSAIVRTSLLGRVLDFVSALPQYSYSSSTFGVSGYHAEHWFLERFIGRLLACAAQAPETADAILGRIWALLGDLVGILESREQDRIVTFALPALLGAMEALEKSPFRYRSSDVLRADALSQRLLEPAVIENIHKAITAPAATAAVRRTIALYLQKDIGLSGSYVLAQFLL
ncbi:phosphatidylinositol-4- kinase, partial [Linderina pennispora]